MSSWQLIAIGALLTLLALGFWWYERSRPSSRMLGLVAALAALAVAGRLVLAPIPNVVATTDIALITGYSLGAAPGFAVGALAAPISNLWLGQGPWTIWQMAGWGLAGLVGAWFAMAAHRRAGRLGLAGVCGAMGFVYGALLDLSVMVSFGGEQSLDRYLALSARGLPFNIAHAAGNFAIAYAAGPALVRMISRYRTRLEFRWHPAGALPLALAAAVFAIGIAAPQPAQADGRSAAWLLSQQRPDGGFPASIGGSSSPAMTGWAMLGMESAGVNPLDVSRGGRTPVDYLRRTAAEIRSTGDLERTILALDAAGVSPRAFAGRNLVSELTARRRGDGSFEGQVNLTAFGVLALEAAGSGSGSSVGWLERAQNSNGGWGFRPDVGSDADSTGAVLQALAAGGGSAGVIRGGAEYLATSQRSDGSWSLSGGASNSQSTSWAIQGLVAAGQSGPVAKGLSYLGSVHKGRGRYAYSASRDQTQIWVTAQALQAVNRRALPLATVARGPARRGGARGNSGRGSGNEAGPGTSAGVGGAERRDGRVPGRPGGSKLPSGKLPNPSGTKGPAAAPERPAAPAATALAQQAAEEAPPPGDGDIARYVIGGFAGLLLAMAGGFLWYRRRLP